MPHAAPPRALTVPGVEEQLPGRPGRRVWLTVRRQGIGQPLDIEVVRGPAEPETVLGVRRQANDSWDFLLNRQHQIGYIRIVAFSQHTHHELPARLPASKSRG